VIAFNAAGVAATAGVVVVAATAATAGTTPNPFIEFLVRFAT
jgi:hypothetical protein